MGRPATVAHDPGQEDERIRPVTRNKEPAPEAMSTYGPWMLVQRNRYGARSLFPPQPPNPIVGFGFPILLSTFDRRKSEPQLFSSKVSKQY